MLVNVKKATTEEQVTSLTGVGKTILSTKDNFVNDDILLEVATAGVETGDATATASDIIQGQTAYIADGTKATGTLLAGQYNIVSTLDANNLQTLAISDATHGNLEPLTVTENGTYTRSTGGYNPVTVALPIQPKQFKIAVEGWPNSSRYMYTSAAPSTHYTTKGASVTITEGESIVVYDANNYNGIYINGTRYDMPYETHTYTITPEADLYIFFGEARVVVGDVAHLDMQSDVALTSVDDEWLAYGSTLGVEYAYASITLPSVTTITAALMGYSDNTTYWGFDTSGIATNPVQGSWSWVGQAGDYPIFMMVSIKLIDQSTWTYAIGCTSWFAQTTQPHVYVNTDTLSNMMSNGIAIELDTGWNNYYDDINYPTAILQCMEPEE